MYLLLSSFASMSLAESGRDDYDLDDDGLIEINDLADLDAIRDYYSLNGSQLYSSNAGCPGTGCNGFELTTDLDFDTNQNGVMDEGDTYWNNGNGWLPIRFDNYGYTGARFEGNGHQIRNLTINNASQDYAALFYSMVGTRVSNLAFTGTHASITGHDYVGALAGTMSSGTVESVVSVITVNGNSKVGGLIGHLSHSTMTELLLTGPVSGTEYVGAAAGRVFGNTDVSYSVSTAKVQATTLFSGAFFGGVFNSTTPSSSDPSTTGVFFSVDATGQDYGGGSGVINGNSRKVNAITDFQCPTAEAPTDGECTAVFGFLFGPGDSNWDLGTSEQLIGLNLAGTLYRDSDGDGSLDADDALPYDSDNDGVNNSDDPYPTDADNDGVTDARDAYPHDFDNDGVDDDVDAFPVNAAASVDADEDGLPDEWNSNCDTSCRENSGLTLDADFNSDESDSSAAPSESADSSGSASWVLLLLLIMLMTHRRALPVQAIAHR